MKTNLALSTAPAAKGRRAPSQQQMAQRQTIAMLGQIWRSLSFAEKATWTTASKQVNGANPSSATNVSRFSPYATFIQAAGTLYATTGAVPRTATLPPAYPADLQGLQLATSAPGRPFSLTIVGSIYPNRVLVRAAPPVPAGHTTYKKNAFKIIGALADISGSEDITALWTAHYIAPGPGASIAIELIGVSTSGIRTAPTFYSVVTGGSAADFVPAIEGADSPIEGADSPLTLG